MDLVVTNPPPLPGTVLRAMSATDFNDLTRAMRLLETTSLASRLSNVFGRQIDFFGKMLPDAARRTISAAVVVAMRGAMRVALQSLGKDGTTGKKAARPLFHRALVTASGAAGGALGLVSLPIELPVTTTLMLRAIADIARSEGEPMDTPDAVLACLEVFAYGGLSKDADFSETGYFAVRGLMAKSLGEASRYLVSRSLAEESAPALLRLIGQIAARFGVAVGQKAAAQAVPVLGALGGAAVNFAFTAHFQDIARGHFILRRLERLYGADLIRTEYERVLRAEKGEAFPPPQDHPTVA